MIQFKSKELESAIDSRANGRMNAHATARRDIERYYWMLETSMPTLSRAEASLICDACNGWAAWDSPRSPGYLRVEIEDACKKGLAEKWGIDGEAFLRRLTGMSPANIYALVDASERFWARVAAAGDARVEDYFKLEVEP